MSETMEKSDVSRTDRCYDVLYGLSNCVISDDFA